MVDGCGDQILVAVTANGYRNCPSTHMVDACWVRIIEICLRQWNEHGPLIVGQSSCYNETCGPTSFEHKNYTLTIKCLNPQQRVVALWSLMTSYSCQQPRSCFRLCLAKDAHTAFVHPFMAHMPPFFDAKTSDQNHWSCGSDIGSPPWSLGRFVWPHGWPRGAEVREEHRKWSRNWQRTWSGGVKCWFLVVKCSWFYYPG